MTHLTLTMVVALAAVQCVGRIYLRWTMNNKGGTHDREHSNKSDAGKVSAQDSKDVVLKVSAKVGAA